MAEVAFLAYAWTLTFFYPAALGFEPVVIATYETRAECESMASIHVPVYRPARPSCVPTSKE